MPGRFCGCGRSPGRLAPARDDQRLRHPLRRHPQPRPGYAVSIVEAGLTAVGRDGGRVRPPLTDLTKSAAHRHPDGGPRKVPDGPEDPCGCPTQAPPLPIPRPARSRTSRPHEASVRKPQHAGHSLWPLRHSSAKLTLRDFSGTSPGPWARTGFRGRSSGSYPRRATPLLLVERQRRPGCAKAASMAALPLAPARGRKCASCAAESARTPSVIAEVQQPFDASVVDRAMRGWSRAAVTLPDRRHIGGRHHADRRRGT